MQKLKEERKKNIKIRLQCDMDAGTIRKGFKITLMGIFRAMITKQ